MSADLHGWVEVRQLAPKWSGLLALNPLVGRARQAFPLLYQSFPRTGARAARYQLSPLADASHEMNYLRAEAGLEEIPCFTIGWAEIQALSDGPTVSWPRIDIELWWRDSDGLYHLKSAAHQLARLTTAEAVTALDSQEPFDKEQYRYVVKHSRMTIELPEEWQTISQAMRHAATTWGAENVRMVGFFD